MTWQAVIEQRDLYSVQHGDCLDFLKQMPEQSVDLIFGSPPYCDARTYGIKADRRLDAWVEWMLNVSEEALRVSKGLVCWVVAGVHRQRAYWPGPEGLIWEWRKRGHCQYGPTIWWKVDDKGGGTGIPGSGGDDRFRNDWEYILMLKREGKLPYADPTVCGHPPVYERAGGEMSNRLKDGTRTNEVNPGARPMPKKVNPGNFMPLVNARVGGGHMGDRVCHLGDAPFPEKLPERFVLTYCPVGGIVLDPFSGTGTTGSVSIRWQRKFVGFDLDQEMVHLATHRIERTTPMMFL